MKKKVLFICIHNSARSQMAEAWLNHLFGDRFEAYSAGLEAGTLNPFAVAVMKEVGIDKINNSCGMDASPVIEGIGLINDNLELLLGALR